MKSKVLNNGISHRNPWGYPNLTTDQERIILAELFEQLMLFDKVIISTNRVNFALYFLIKNLGIKTVEQLVEKDCISFMLWTPLLVTGGPRQLEDGSEDISVIYSQPPVVAGTFSDEDIDPENNVDRALSNFQLTREEKRNLIRKIIKKYTVPDGMALSSDSAELVIDSYKKGLLDSFGLPFEKEPNLLSVEERHNMLGIGISLLETSILSDFDLKSYRNFEHFNIIKQSIERIGKAYKISENSDAVFEYEHLPDLKKLFIQENLSFDTVFKLRHTGNAKYFRKWINGIGEVVNSKEITIEYLDEIKGKNKYTETEDKLMITLASVMAGAGLSAMNPMAGLIVGAGVTIFDSYILQNIWRGKNPSMFVEEIKAKVK